MSAANPWALGPELTIAHAAEHHARLLEQLATHDEDLVLDLAGVTEFDSSGVQLLLALRKSLAERGHVLRLLAPPAAVRDALATFGLAATFDTPCLQ